MKKRSGLIVLLFLSVLIFNVGMIASYDVLFNQRKSNILREKSFIQYDVSNSINIANTYPMDDDKAGNSYSQEYQEMIISVRNTSNVEELEYYIVLEGINDASLINDLVYSISLDGINYTDSRIFEYDEKNKMVVIYTGRIKKSDNRIFEDNIHLRIWISESNDNQNSIQNKSFKAIVNVYYDLK